MGLGLGGEAEREAGPRRCRVAGEVAVVLVGDAARDRETKAVAGFAGVESDEAFEDLFALVSGTPGPSSVTSACT